jgi:hypothetical protein
VVPNRESRSNRRSIITCIGIICLVSIALIVILLDPEKPNPSGDSGYQEKDPEYYPGGSECYPSNLMRTAGREGAEKAIACAEAAEQHRLSTNDLIQQRRSANAADAITVLTYEQARVSKWALVFSVLTFAAAAAAAVYARSAIRATRKIGQAQVRAYITVEGVPDIKRIEAGRPIADLSVRNTGQSPAYSVSFLHTLFVDDFPHVAQDDDLIEAEPGDVPPNVTIAASTTITTKVDGEPIALADIDLILNDGAVRALYLCCIVTYKDVFDDPHVTKVLSHLVIEGEPTFNEDGIRTSHYGFTPVVGPHNYAN